MSAFTGSLEGLEEIIRDAKQALRIYDEEEILSVKNEEAKRILRFDIEDSLELLQCSIDEFEKISAQLDTILNLLYKEEDYY